MAPPTVVWPQTGLSASAKRPLPDQVGAQAPAGRGVLEDRVQPATVLSIMCVDSFFRVGMCGTCHVLLTSLFRSSYKVIFSFLLYLKMCNGMS